MKAIKVVVLFASRDHKVSTATMYTDLLLVQRALGNFLLKMLRIPHPPPTPQNVAKTQKRLSSDTLWDLKFGYMTHTLTLTLTLTTTLDIPQPDPNPNDNPLGYPPT